MNKKRKRKEKKTLRYFKNRILPNMTYYDLMSMISYTDNTNEENDNISLKSDKPSSYVLQNKDCAEFIVSTILKETDGDMVVDIKLDTDNIEFKEYSVQKAYRNRKGKRSIIADFVGEIMGRKAIVNIERQRLRKGMSLYRIRFYSAMFDINNLDEGNDFTELPINYMIFICEKEPFYIEKKDSSKVRKIYHIVNVIAETGDVVDNGVKAFYLNLSAPEDDTPLGKLIHDLKCTNPDDMYNKLLADELRYYKYNVKGVDILYNMWYSAKDDMEELMCKLQKSEKKSQILSKELDEAKEKLETITLKSISCMLKNGYSVKDISEQLGMKASDIKKIIKDNNLNEN